ncbi:hypothetical protein EF888_12835 [Silicimonas algicola]|uniref:AAA ATPase-like protein n=1 Tax=Silicimonas algicola TaxID=1826607 RepID=A0A316G9M9_9RHOB|nr:hypothetical protein [Silicimonas algicola]AZQ67944.1 hypothetical protein EF888_12835 [Silicimonas algicola]PWK57621.1 hypothetical protein C8D95_102266 [Silicimonas algicola]
MSSLLSGLLKGTNEQIGDGGTYLTKFGLLRNPFPPARTIYPEVIYNQEDALHRFADGVKAICGSDLARRSLAVLGGTGQGKSHFLRHCQHAVKQAELPVISVEFSAGSGSAATLVREIFRAADEHVKSRGEQDLLSAISSRIEDNDFGPIRQTDLKSALKALVASQKQGFKPEDSFGRFTSDALLEVSRRWVVGETLTQTERRYLHVSSRLSTASLMIRVLTELFALARQQRLFMGAMVCIDEVEALFRSGLSTSKVQGFLQDIRYLFDEAVGQFSGYSLLILAGSTGQGAQNLRDYNYPLFQRLGFETESRVELHEVKTLDEARAFADVYIDFECKRFNMARGESFPITRSRTLIDNDDLEKAFRADSRSTKNQARLLEELHRIVEEKRSGA